MNLPKIKNPKDWTVFPDPPLKPDFYYQLHCDQKKFIDDLISSDYEFGGNINSISVHKCIKNKNIEFTKYITINKDHSLSFMFGLDTPRKYGTRSFPAFPLIYYKQILDYWGIFIDEFSKIRNEIDKLDLVFSGCDKVAIATWQLWSLCYEDKWPICHLRRKGWMLLPLFDTKNIIPKLELFTPFTAYII